MSKARMKYAHTAMRLDARLAIGGPPVISRRNYRLGCAGHCSTERLFRMQRSAGKTAPHRVTADASTTPRRAHAAAYATAPAVRTALCRYRQESPVRLHGSAVLRRSRERAQELDRSTASPRVNGLAARAGRRGR